LPASTILDGHRRVRLLAGIGKTEVDVVVRDDLKDADAAAVEAEFLKFNFQRRQLHPLDKARIAKRLFELEKKRSSQVIRTSDKAALRDRVGKAMGMSGRNLERYLHVLDTPLPVQHAVRDGRLRLVAGAKIALLPQAQQQKIAEQINGVSDPAEIARIIDADVSLPDGRRHEKVGDALATLARHLERSTIDLGDRLERVTPGMAARYLPPLQDAAKMLNQLLRLAKSDKQRPSHPAFAE
jgi:ParB-like chromosome segregation protein Spo0J